MPGAGPAHLRLLLPNLPEILPVRQRLGLQGCGKKKGVRGVSISEIAICAINAEARRRGLSYGQMVQTAGKEELQEIIMKYIRKRKNK